MEVEKKNASKMKEEEEEWGEGYDDYSSSGGFEEWSGDDSDKDQSENMEMLDLKRVESK